MTRSELPPDLVWLGDQLEAATSRAVRRRSRRQSLLGGVATLVIGVALAFGMAAGKLAPGERPLPVSADSASSLQAAIAPLTLAHGVRHIPDERVAHPNPPVCLDGHDCRLRLHPQITPAPDRLI